MSLWKREIKHKDGSVSIVWYGEINKPTGRRYQSGRPIYKRESFSLGLDASKVSRRAATAELNRRLVEIEQQQNNMPSGQDATLADFSDYYIDYCRDIIGKRSWERDEQSLKFLKEFFVNARLSEITPGDIIDYQRKRKKDGRSNRTVNLELACLRHVYNVARLREVFKGENPVAKVRFLEVDNIIDRILTPEEEKRLLAASPEFLRNIITCALQTGMRQAEILFLEWKNVDLKNNYVYIESARAKTRRLRRVPISSALKSLLVNLKAANKHKERVFLNHHNKPYARASAIQGIFTAARKRAGIEGFRFHDLRHTAATRLVEGGADISRVAKILGHQDVRMTQQRYSHPDQSLKDDIEILSGYIHDNYHDSKESSQQD